MSNRLERSNFELITSDLTNFEKKLQEMELIRYIENPKDFFKETAYLKRVNGRESYYYLFTQIKSNNFNRGSGYLTHGIDFYRGSFHAQMIRGLINYCNLKKGSLILDCFCGSGTSLVEASLLGFDSIGIDINPIACLNTKVKTGLLDCDQNVLKSVLKYNLDYFNHVDFSIKDFKTILNKNLGFLVSLFIYTRVLSMERRLSFTKSKAFSIVYNKIEKVITKFDKLKKDLDLNLGRASIHFNDNLTKLRKFPDNYVDAIITSPPYLDLIDYIQEDIVQLNYLFSQNQILKIKDQSIGNREEKRELSLFLYWNKIKAVLYELNRVLKNNAKAILIIGDYGTMRLDFQKYALDCGFKIENILRRNIVNIKRKDNIEYVLILNKKT